MNFYCKVDEPRLVIVVVLSNVINDTANNVDTRKMWQMYIGEKSIAILIVQAPEINLWGKLEIVILELFAYKQVLARSRHLLMCFLCLAPPVWRSLLQR